MRDDSLIVRSPSERPQRELSLEQERLLIERAKAGDRGAFRSLYLLHRNTVRSHAILPLIRDRDRAEELLADTFVRALANLHRFRWQARGLLPWLIRIGKNLCFDHLRRAAREAAWPEDLEQWLPDRSTEDAESLLARVELSALLRERIDVCMAEILPRYREVLTLRFIDKRSRSEIAAELGLNIGTVDVLLFRACRAFRRVYLRRYANAAPQQR